MSTTIHPPRRLARIIERVRRRDREYFARHPGETEYLRPYVPGEVWPVLDTSCTHVLVTQLAPGIRHKALLILPEGRGDA
jgi:hypothetical protein